MKKLLFLLMFPVFCFGQTELDSLQKQLKSDSILQAALTSFDSIFESLNKKLELSDMADKKFENGDYYGAIYDYTKLIELEPESDAVYLTYYNRGVAKSKLGDRYGAISDFTYATEINPEYCNAYISMALAKILNQDLLGAITDICKAIELDSKNANAYKVRGMVFSQFQGTPIKTQMCSDWRKACDLGDEDACKYYSEYCY